jgi:hypothetical protein
VLNSIMISVAGVFVLSIILGRVIQLKTRSKMMAAFATIMEGLNDAEQTGAPLQSLFSLLPVFTTLITEGKKLENVAHRAGQIWACWGLVWLLVSLRFRSGGTQQANFLSLSLSR